MPTLLKHFEQDGGYHYVEENNLYLLSLLLPSPPQPLEEGEYGGGGTAKTMPCTGSYARSLFYDEFPLCVGVKP